MKRLIHSYISTASALLSVSLLCFSVFPSSSSNAEESCPSNTVGLCTPGVTEVIESDTVTTTSTSGTGTTTTETTTTETTTTTITNEDVGDLLTDQKVSAMGRNQKYGGDMTTDWGGQGPANMPSGSTCGDLGTDRCAQIRGAGNSTSTMGVPGMGTTFIQTINVSSLGIGSSGGRTNYTIKIEKRDASDRIYMHITGKDGSTVSFAGTDILSEAGVASGYQAYSGGFDFGGTLTSLIVEVGGRDISLSIGPLFDDVTVNVLYNVISTIVTEQITTIESFIALGIFDQETIDVATNVFENNDISIGAGGQTDIQPSDMEMPAPEISAEVEAEVEVEIEAEISNEMEVTAPTEEAETTETAEADVNEDGDEPAEAKQKKKQKAANKIVKKMSDKGRYDGGNQMKTLVVMNILGNSKQFFAMSVALKDTQAGRMFTAARVPDAVLPSNNYSQYFLFGGSSVAHDALVDSQYKG